MQKHAPAVVSSLLRVFLPFFFIFILVFSSCHFHPTLHPTSRLPSQARASLTLVVASLDLTTTDIMGSVATTAPFRFLIVGGSYAGLSSALNLIDICSGRSPRMAQDPYPRYLPELSPAPLEPL